MKKIVLTGGPCAGKTTMTEVISKTFGDRVTIIPESASLLFSGGFPRWPEKEALRATQHAIYQVQCSLEKAFGAKYPQHIFILDRATIDCAAYWPDTPDDFFKTENTSLENEFSRYHQIIYLESAGKTAYESHQSKNPNRTEDWAQAKVLDEKTCALWKQHPHFTFIHNNKSFKQKITEVLELIEKYIENP